MVAKYINKGRIVLFNILETLLFTSRKNNNNGPIILLKMDRIGDYLLFRNFIKETYNYYKGLKKIYLCGNAAWKDLSEKLDGKYIAGYIWVDVPRLDKYTYRFSIYRKLRKLRGGMIWHCTYSRTSQSDNLAVYSGVTNIIGFYGDEINIPVELKLQNNFKYTQLIQSKKDCLFEFYRNRDFFESVLNTTLKINAPYVESEPPGINEKNKYIVIFPGALRKEKQWSVDNYIILCNKLYEFFNLKIMLCGSENERYLGDKIAAGAGNCINNTIGQYSFYEMIKIINGAKFVVSNDSAPLHLSLCLHVPAVCIFNGNLYGRFCPYPKEMELELLTVLPDKMEAQMENKEMINAFRCKNSTIDINEILPEKVYSLIKMRYS